ncbi:MAG TPA: hypothetical protein VM347_30280 [Nonomuraea sp.]|nr:hypothetical protein [Nonomuraea sp.]
MASYEASVPVYFQRIYLGNYPMPLEDSPFEKHDFGPLAVSAGDSIGLNSITSNHTARDARRLRLRGRRAGGDT